MPTRRQPGEHHARGQVRDAIRYIIYYAAGFAGVVNVAIAASWLFAINDQVYAWLGQNRQFTVSVVVLSIAIYAAYIGLDKEARRGRANAKRMKRED
jgi:hypothetical protein